MDKGASEHCCCTGCDQAPLIWSGGSGQDFQKMQTWKRGCCSCVPKYACVTVIGPGGSDSAIYKLYCPPAPLDPPEDQPLYTGPALNVGSLSVDIQVHFLVDAGYNCQMCISSAALGIARGDVCLPIDAALRSTEWCRTFNHYGQPYTEMRWGDYRIRISKADHMPITGRTSCVDESGRVIYDQDTLKNLCCNCNCICRCMCLTISPTAQPMRVVTGCYYKGNWRFEDGTTVSLYRKPSGQCALRLNVGPGYNYDFTVDNRCPRPTARWLVTSGINETTAYDMRCMGCNGCGLTISECCPGRSTFPSTIYADVTNNCCGALTVPMGWDSGIRQYVGSAIFCGGHPITLSTGCPFTNLSFSGPPCVSVGASDPSASCNPILGNFTINTGGINCCPGQMMGGVTLGVTLHE